MPNVLDALVRMNKTTSNAFILWNAPLHNKIDNASLAHQMRYGTRYGVDTNVFGQRVSEFHNIISTGVASEPSTAKWADKQKQNSTKCFRYRSITACTPHRIQLEFESSWKSELQMKWRNFNSLTLSNHTVGYFGRMWFMCVAFRPWISAQTKQKLLKTKIDLPVTSKISEFQRVLQCSIIVIIIWVQGIVAHRSSLVFALFNLLFTFVLNWSVHESEIMILEHARNYYFLFDYPVVRTQRHSTMFQSHIVHRYRCKMHQLFIFICSSHKCGIHERRTEQING